MVLMSVGNAESLNLVGVLQQIGHIGDNQIHSQHVILREGEATVHQHNAVLAFKGRNVHSDLFQSSQRYNL